MGEGDENCENGPFHSSMCLVGKSMLLALDARKRRMLYNSGPAR